MPSQRGKIAGVSASVALAAANDNQLKLSRQPPGLLARIRLVAIVRIPVLATSGTEAALTAQQGFGANGARFGFYHKRIIRKQADDRFPLHCYDAATGL